MKKFFVSLICLTLVLSIIFWAECGIVPVNAGKNNQSFTPTANEVCEIEKIFDIQPYTFEATICLDANLTERGGTILGNYKDRNQDALSFEIYTDGHPRLYINDYNSKNNKSTSWSYIFDSVNVCTGQPVRLTVVRDETAIICYVDGIEMQRLSKDDNGLSVTDMQEPAISNKLVVGGDLRSDNKNYFKGEIFDIAVWSDVRTATEISNTNIENVDFSDLIAAYNFDGSVIPNVDLSKHGYDIVGDLNIDVNGIYNNESLEKGISFDDNIRYQTEEALSKQVHTISSWIYLPETLADNERGGVILGNYELEKECYSFEIYSSGNPRFYHVNEKNEVSSIIFTGIDIRAEEWVHLAFTIDEENNEVSCYVNGACRAKKIAPYDISLSDVSSKVALGGDLRTGNGQYFKGKILEVALYENVLTSSDIMYLYTLGVNKDDNSLFAYYELMSATQEDIIDESDNGNDMNLRMRYFPDKEPVTDYAYSFAVVGDTQTVVWNDVQNNTNNLSKIYDYILANKDEKKIKYVFGLGDITDKNDVREWERAQREISKLDGEIPYLLNRGNHDGVYQNDNVSFTRYMGTDDYCKQFESGGYFKEGNIDNSWIKFSVGNIDYLVFALDFGIKDDVIDWASEIISAHPHHNVIITTHAYLYRDGTTLDSQDTAPPSMYNSNYNDGDDVWEKLISKHKNIVLVLCGHDPCEKIIMAQDKGEHGNIVTQMLIDPQYVDRDEGATGMVAMLYFSEDGKKVQVEYYSTIREKFFLPENQFSFDIDVALKGDITVTFDSNGGSAVTAQTIEKGQMATKPTDPTKDGFDFKGWTLNGSAYDFNTAVNSNITLVATWEQQQVVPTTYIVSFAANGGTGTMADVTGVSGEYTLIENGFTAPDGKRFKAWSVNGNEKAVGDKITVTADTTVTAVWEIIPAGHTCDIKPVDKVNPSCTEGGKQAYYKCEGCGKFFEDALGAKEITDLAVWGNISKNGHTESAWKSDKDNHWKECTVVACGVIIENSKAAHADANNDGKCDTCEYNVGTTTTDPGNKPSDDVNSPQTGDNSMMWLWVALLVVSGFGSISTIVMRKKFVR